MKRLETRRKTPLGYLVFMLIELATAYGLFSLAVDRGSLLYYLITLIFLIGSLKNLVNLIKRLIHARPTPKTS